jgi:archaeoflavoprotein AfpA
MALKFAWAITGAGDYLPESVTVMQEIAQKYDVELMVFLSKAGQQVITWYKLQDKLKAITPKITLEKDSNTPFIPGALQKGIYRFLVVMPATANTVAKIVHGIADTLVTNSVAQAQKTGVPIYIYPVDQKPGSITTILPSGEKLKLTTREIDLANIEKLRTMKGMNVLGHPSELHEIIRNYQK